MLSLNVRYFALLSCSIRALAELLPRSFRALSMLSFAFEMLFSRSFLATQCSILLLFFRDVRVFFAFLCSFRAQYTFITNNYTVCVQFSALFVLFSCSFRNGQNPNREHARVPGRDRDRGLFPI